MSSPPNTGDLVIIKATGEIAKVMFALENGYIRAWVDRGYGLTHRPVLAEEYEVVFTK